MLGITGTNARERLLGISDLTLERGIVVVRSAEATERQLKYLANDSSVHGPFRRTLSANEDDDPSSSSKVFNCRNCGTRHGVRECPAYGKTCHNCQGQHHFQSMCKSQKKVHWLMPAEEEYDCDSTPLVGAVTTGVQIKNDECYRTSPVQGHRT